MANLHFRKDGNFKIVQFTDLHWQNGEAEDQQTYALMKSILEAESPDLIIFTGDVIYSEHCKNTIDSYRNAVKVANEFQIPWAAVFGNHDAEKGSSKQELIALQQSIPLCLTEIGPHLDNRFGNFVLEVHSSSNDAPAAALYLLDSGENTNHPIGGYEWITHKQIGWYKEQANRLTKQNNETPIPSLAFFHIPVPEYTEVWEQHTCYGDNFEGVGSPKINSGLFTAFLEQKDVLGVFVGHDHINDYWGELHGVRLCYGRATGYQTYGKEGFPRGARIINLTEGIRGFQTWLRLDDGTVVTDQQAHFPE